MVDKDLKMNLYKYGINVTVTAGDTYEMRDGTVLGLSITNEYLQRRIPLALLQLELPSDIIGAIYQNESTAKISLTMVEKVYDPDNGLISTSTHLNKAFDIIPKIASTEYNVSTDTDTQANHNDMHQIDLFECYLYDDSFVKAYDTTFAGVITGQSNTTILSALLMYRGISSDVVATIPSGGGSSVTISTGNLEENIEEINTMYGMYPITPTIFNDFKYTYILNRYSPNITMPDVTDYGSAVFILKNVTDEEYSISGEYADSEEEKHYIKLDVTPEIIDNSSSVGKTNFANITGVASGGSVSSVTTSANDAKQVVVKQYHTLSLDRAYNDTQGVHHVMVEVNNSRIATLRPYKTFSFLTDTGYSDLDLSGVYAIDWVTTHLRRDGEEYIHKSTMQLTRKP